MMNPVLDLCRVGKSLRMNSPTSDLGMVDRIRTVSSLPAEVASTAWADMADVVATTKLSENAKKGDILKILTVGEACEGEKVGCG